MTPFQNVLSLQHDCVSICEELLLCLDTEKTNLIEFRVDEVMQSNTVKERLNQRLKEAKEKLNHALVLYYNVETPNALTSILEDEREIEAWNKSREQWDALWDQTRSSLETNLLFIKHSLKNLSLLGDNLKRLLGARPVYTNQGKKVDVQTEGKVVQGAI